MAKFWAVLYSSISDIDLWNAFTSGDQQAFSDLFKRFYPLLFQYGTKITTDSSALEDAIQELFIELWQKRETLSVVSVRSYLLQALKFKLFKLFRVKSPLVNREELEETVFDISHETFLINQQNEHAQSNAIIAALNQLSPRQREVIYLKIYKGLSYEEISLVMNINYQVVRNLLCQALKTVRKLCRFILLPALSLIA